MAKRKHQEKITELKTLMLRSKFWTLKEDAEEVLNYYLNNGFIERKFESRVSPKELMALWPNW